MRIVAMGVLAALLTPAIASAQDAQWVTAPIYRDVAKYHADRAWADHRTVPTPVWHAQEASVTSVVTEQKEAGH
ncbi:MAG: hypothetical protein EOP84_07580 [Verrucomicrobiaceae bacterium]|nr:MAG: hypothetical protein EOP84_07580 [Verrucomicrobiaceae bacterium]